MALALDLSTLSSARLIGKVGMSSSGGRSNNAIHTASDITRTSIVVKEVLALVSGSVDVLLARVRDDTYRRRMGSGSKCSHNVVHLIRGVFVSRMDFSESVDDSQNWSHPGYIVA
jgi:hypothetical protein